MSHYFRELEETLLEQSSDTKAIDNPNGYFSQTGLDTLPDWDASQHIINELVAKYLPRLEMELRSKLVESYQTGRAHFKKQTEETEASEPHNNTSSTTF